MLRSLSAPSPLLAPPLPPPPPAPSLEWGTLLARSLASTSQCQSFPQNQQRILLFLLNQEMRKLYIDKCVKKYPSQNFYFHALFPVFAPPCLDAAWKSKASFREPSGAAACGTLYNSPLVGPGRGPLSHGESHRPVCGRSDSRPLLAEE